jgi:hypothetical protein
VQTDKKKEITQKEELIRLLELEERRIIETLAATVSNEERLRQKLEKEKNISSPVKQPKQVQDLAASVNGN